jgi:hypothetical protein
METTTIERWLYGVLSTDATLTGLVGSRIYSYVAPVNATYPLIIFQYQTGSDLMGVGPVRIWSDSVYVIKAINRMESYSTLKTIADRVDVLLHAESGSVTDGRVVGCVRERAYSMLELVDTVQVRHLGGIYRIMAQDT